jgi:hypothetical protein
MGISSGEVQSESDFNLYNPLVKATNQAIKQMGEPPNVE